MSKEIYISSTPHETRLAIVENEALSEIYYERENEYTLAGSIYNGRVTRVLPGMQSAFVDIGLERDAFLYITDFMEEVPDSAEFDTTSASDQRAVRSSNQGEPAAPREERGSDRGGRGRRSGRDRGGNEGASRGGHAENGEASAAGEELYRQARPVQEPGEGYGEAAVSGPQESGEAGTRGAEAEGGEGSRRWRGRRGRRRGGRGGQASAGAAAQGAPSAPGEPVAEPEGETLYEGGAQFDEAQENEGYDLGAAAEPALPASVPGERRVGRRDRGRADRPRESRGEPQQDPYQEQRGESRGEGRPQRFPRGFAPSRNLYNVGDSEGSGGAPGSAEPIVLPGESLSKYRKPGEAPAAGAAPAPPAAVPLAPPANLYTLAEGWDGGEVLPGETLSRRRAPEARASHGESQRPARFERGSRREGRGERPGRFSQEERAPMAASASEAPQRESAPAQPESPAAVGLEPQHAGEEQETAVVQQGLPTGSEQPEAAEYEPTEAAVSYRVDPTGPAEFRHSAPVVEENDAFEEETTTDSAAHLNLAHMITPGPEDATERLHSESTAEQAPEASATESFASAEPALVQADSVLAEPEVLSHREVVVQPELSTQPATSAPSQVDAQPEMAAHDITSLDPAGAMHSHVESAAAPETAAVAQPDEEVADATRFEQGEGEISEEILDDEEPVGGTLHASSFEELDDVEEETLEGTADLGTMLREMSIDSITRVSPEPEDDFEEDELEGDLEEEALEESAAREDAAYEEASDHAAAEAQHVGYAEGEEEAGQEERRGDGYSNEEASPVREGERRGRRDGRKDGRRGRGERGDRPRTAGGERGGRGRHSVQATNLPAISDLLKPGQEILVQIAKEPIAKKGARITSHIALPGRFLVFMPTVNHTGVSRKIESDGERRRLKEILLSEKGDASGGFIVRTAASGATEEELRSDLRFLLNLWADIKARSESSKSPALIYHDLNLIERILRDQVTDTFSAIWVDSETEYERVLRFLQRFQPSLIRRVKLYLKETPLFEQFGIAEEINKALRSKVWLKSGGSIVINQTEALVAIDINTGKYVGKTARLEDTIVKTNLDAIPEIVRQIRLRDLGGIIIIDFIDMDERKNRNRVMAALEEELKSDRAPSKVLQFNDFGLVAITRKRVKQSLERTLSTPCTVCQGTGMVKSPVTVCNDIYIEMRKMQKHLERGDVMLRVHPEVVKQLKSSGAKWLQEMEEMVGKTILVKSDPSLHPEQFDIH